MNIKISADSTVDLPKEVLERYDISITPLTITLCGKTYRDTLELTPDDIYREVEAGNNIPKTSAVNVYEYLELFEKSKDLGHHLHFNIGSKFSSTHQNALLASQEFEHVTVIDTENLSAGSGLLVLEACEMRDKGINKDEIIEHINHLIKKVKVNFVIDTLEYVRKGGRISSLTQKGAETLKLHPTIFVEEGEMKIGKLYRGSQEKALQKYASQFMNQISLYHPKRVILAHSGCEPALIDSIYQTIEEANYFEEILVTRAGCVISTHSGPNTLGLLGIEL